MRAAQVLLSAAVALLVGAVVGATVPTQAPSAGAQAPANQTPTAQTYPADQLEAGQKIFAAQCGFCHGRDAMGGESGPDLARAALVAADVRGDKIGPVVRNGRLDKGMPAFNVSEADLVAIVAFIHDQKRKADLPGSRRTVDVGDLQSGNVDAGKRYFENACTKCHSSTGDLKGIATRVKGLALLQRMLYPGSGREAASPSPPKATVSLPSGEKVSGIVAYQDEFTIALTDAYGWYRSWSTAHVKFTVDDPLQAHVDQLGRYTDRDMHNVIAYLQTLR